MVRAVLQKRNPSNRLLRSTRYVDEGNHRVPYQRSRMIQVRHALPAARRQPARIHHRRNETRQGEGIRTERSRAQDIEDFRRYRQGSRDFPPPMVRRVEVFDRNHAPIPIFEEVQQEPRDVHFRAGTRRTQPLRRRDEVFVHERSGGVHNKAANRSDYRSQRQLAPIICDLAFSRYYRNI